MRCNICLLAFIPVLICLNGSSFNAAAHMSSCPRCSQDGNTLATISGPNFINDAACLIGTANTGISIAPAAINIIPELINIVPEGVGIFPQGAARCVSTCARCPIMHACMQAVAAGSVQTAC